MHNDAATETGNLVIITDKKATCVDKNAQFFKTVSSVSFDYKEWIKDFLLRSPAPLIMCSPFLTLKIWLRPWY